MNLGAFQPKGITKYQENCILGMKSNPWVVAGSSILNELEESATKKLNKHSNSLDNIDWLACYDKLKKELKPKGCQISSNRCRAFQMKCSAVVLNHGLGGPLIFINAYQNMLDKGYSWTRVGKQWSRRRTAGILRV